MTKIKWLTVLLFFVSVADAQQGFLILKKRNKNLLSYFKGSHIVFQLKDGQWLSGTITKITPDSLWLTQEIIRYKGQLADTLRYYNTGIPINEIDALPTNKELVNYDMNGNIHIILGHEKFVWVRNGFVFRVMGAGYIGLNVANHLIDKDPPFASNNLGRLAGAVAVLFFGETLKVFFYPHWKIGKKYHFQYM